MRHDGRRGRPEILGRLRSEAEDRQDERAGPSWARPVGWLIALGIVAVVVAVILGANPL